jgi:putative ATPase
MKGLGYGREYRYAHDEPDGFAAGESYLPEGVAPPPFYEPAPRGLEQRIAERLSDLRRRNDEAKNPR